MKKAILVTLLAMVSSAHGANNTNESPDDRLIACTASAQAISERKACFEAAYQGWEGIMNQQYQSLMRDKSQTVKDSLKKSQDAWIQYRDAYIEAAENTYWEFEAVDGQKKDEKVEGTWQVLTYDMKVRMVRERATELLQVRRSILDF
ncbi:hypothetical protein RC90_19175 [Pectobacterium brasiliense]|uniref:lysozyme inhibitor LprI family protein n=1 Tax=Pectobacterium TaxID=122277 RepID=UPI0004E6C690|nr:MULTISPECIES: lysozyme inhibitor LprI family protein [Pectobacterium]KFF63963.1 hypothetical protein IW00_18085 [Pectobacterium brasiliense]KFF65077.1 hypothetical protein IV99_13060 [Pectobacterium brasiliense]KHS83888.1 hypothetical protein RC83_17880 [Pectobacterium brasiliense]KHS94648.1 hypothetical protein RC90_19175 [Pectobacterium brasiliense]KHT12714.1 hypothetical protein RC94_00410 [Pectobacterium brasiliense]